LAETVKNKIFRIFTDALQEAIDSKIFPKDVQYPAIKIQYPKEEKFGDYASSFALESAKILKKSPLAIGEEIKPFLEKSDIISRVDVVKPGFINVFLHKNVLFENLKLIEKKGTDFWRQKKENPKKYILEFVSANPTGPLNIVSARAAALGDTIGNLIQANGDIIFKEFYVNDYGNQVRLLGISVKARIDEINGVDVDFPENGYQGEYVKQIAKQILDKYSVELKSFSDDKELLDFLARKAIETNLSSQKKDLIDFNVNFDNWFSERVLHENNEVEKTFKILDDKNVIFEEDSKKFFRSTDFGDDKDRVVIRDDGRPTYLLADIAYHRDKIKRGFDEIIDIWGPDHHGYIARLTGALKVLGHTKFKVLIAQQVNLVMEGETVKMSKRLGKFSTMRDLLDEIGVDVARFFFVMRSMESHLDFDLALAKKNSSENPVFYLQYAHARICSIFKEAEKRSLLNDTFDKASIEYLDNPEAIKLMKLISKYPEEIQDAAENFEPHKITTFLMKLAQSFHKLYTVHRILDDNEQNRDSLLLLSNVVRTALRDGLSLLGVSFPERM